MAGYLREGGEWFGGGMQTKLQFTIDYKSKMKTLYNRG